MDPTFYRTAADAIAAPAEELAYVVAFDPAFQKQDALFVVDVNPQSSTYGQVIGSAKVPPGNELHHFGWNACSSALAHPCHSSSNLQRRHLIVPGLRSSNIFIFDIGPNPRAPKLIKPIRSAELSAKAGYSRPHTVHCGPSGVFLTCLGGRDDDEGPGGIALLNHATFAVERAWETCRGPQRFHYDAWWHLNRNTLVSSEWGSPAMIEQGLVPEALLAGEYGHALHFWDLDRGEHRSRIELGEEQQMVLEVRPAHDPDAAWGFVGVAVSREDLSGSVFRWYLDEDADGGGSRQWRAEKVISVPAQQVDDVSSLPLLLQGFGGAVPLIITDIDLSVDDGWLYVACWVTGELKQFDVSDPAHPVETGSVKLGGVIDAAPHPARPDEPIGGGPQMVEVSRDGRRVYFTNSLYSSWDDQFYPKGVGAWMAKVDVLPGGGMELDKDFFPNGDEFEGLRVHQIRLQGGDASTDSYCYPSSTAQGVL